MVRVMCRAGFPNNSGDVGIQISLVGPDACVVADYRTPEREAEVCAKRLETLAGSVGSIGAKRYLSMMSSSFELRSTRKPILGVPISSQLCPP